MNLNKNTGKEVSVVTPNERRFPDGFLWGVATASHQVEGGNENDWTEWEKRGCSKDLSGSACNHWNLEQFRSDLQLAQALGINAYRLSIEWSRVMPQPDKIEYAALAKYLEMLACIREAGMESVVTLHHFTNPLWFVREGGWEKASLRSFLSYAKTTAEYISPLVNFWATFNEPVEYVLSGWRWGIWPPGKKGVTISALRVLRKMIKAHNLTYGIIKAQSSRPVGIVHNFTCYEPASQSIQDRMAALMKDWWRNDLLLMRTRNDFIGVNYYFLERLYVNFFPPRLERLAPRPPLSDFGWEIYPEGLYKVLLSLRRYRLPIYITENGIADAGDKFRPQFIVDHLAAVHRAIAKGMPVKGYFHWSLLDNFEWAEGYTKKFGLIAINRKTGERLLRPSALLYGRIAKSSQLPIELSANDG